MDICWKKVTDYVCSQPLHGRRTTYTECCCQDGEAWSQQCALCPPRSSGELCNCAHPKDGEDTYTMGLSLEQGGFPQRGRAGRGGQYCQELSDGPSTPGHWGSSAVEQHFLFLCPTEVYAQLCNVARIEAEREAGVHFRPGYEYGAGPDDLHYNLYNPDGAPFYNYLGPEDVIPELPFSNPASHPEDHRPVQEPPLPPSELQPHYVASQPGWC